MKRLYAVLLLCLFIGMAVFGLSKAEAEQSGAPQIFRAEDWKGKRISVLTGTWHGELVEKNIPGAEPVYETSMINAIAAMRNGRSDGIIIDDAELRKLIAQTPGLIMLEPFVSTDEFGVVVSKDKPELLEKLNEFIALIKSDGTYDDMTARWLDTAEPPPMPEIPEGTGETLRFATTDLVDGFSYIKDGELTGFDIEFAKRFAAFADAKLVITAGSEHGALIMGVQTGVYDFAASLFTITEERKRTVNFSDPYYTGGAVIAVFDQAGAPQDVNVFAPPVFRPEDWAGRSIGVITGTVHDQVLANFIPGSVPAYFNDMQSSIIALKNGRIDGILSDAKEFNVMLYPHHPDLRALEPYFNEVDAGMLVTKEKPELLQKINDFLALIKANGIYDEMDARWFGGDEIMPEIPEGTGEVLKFGTGGISDGYSYFKNGEITGFDIEFAKRFAAHENMKLEINVMDFSGLIPSIQTGKIDFAANAFTITEERAQSANFTDPYFSGARLLVVYDPLQTQEAGTSQSESFLQSVRSGFERNLIHEDRWKMIADGLRVSLIITVLSFALATLLGFGICGLRMSKNRVLSAVGSAYVTILRGTPIVVLLMITFYVIFAKSSISGVAVAVIAFGANGAAFIGEIIRSAILTIDKGQVEAARSMGFSKTGAFFTVTFPQAVRVAFPVYMSEFISTFKMTSVVGYIAIVDLTKAGDIIRSRTYDAFFPLIMVALVYLIAASVMIWFFNWINRKTDKRLRRSAR